MTNPEDLDLFGLTIDELKELRKRISLILTQRQKLEEETPESEVVYAAMEMALGERMPIAVAKKSRDWTRFRAKVGPNEKYVRQVVGAKTRAERFQVYVQLFEFLVEYLHESQKAVVSFRHISNTMERMPDLADKAYPDYSQVPGALRMCFSLGREEQ